MEHKKGKEQYDSQASQLDLTGVHYILMTGHTKAKIKITSTGQEQTNYEASGDKTKMQTQCTFRNNFLVCAWFGNIKFYGHSYHTQSFYFSESLRVYS